MKSTKERTAGILRKFIADDVVLNDSTSIEELNIDSFKFIQFIVEIEKEFNIEIADDKLDRSEFHNLFDLIEMIDLLAAKGSA